MEEQLLKDMIHDRDKKIVQLEGQLGLFDEQMSKGRNDLEEIRSESSQKKLEHRRVTADLIKKRDKREHELQQAEEEVKNQNGSLHVYAEVLRDASNPGSADSSYVLRMQSQLCKAMHSMGILEHEMELVKENSDETVKSLKDFINSVVEERSKMELELMNQLMAIDDEKKRIEEECKGKLDLESEQLHDLENAAIKESEARAGEDDDDDDDELDDDQKMEYLEELNEAIEEMTEKNAAQRERIKQLQAKLNALGGVQDSEALNGTKDDTNGADGNADESRKEKESHVLTVVVDEDLDPAAEEEQCDTSEI